MKRFATALILCAGLAACAERTEETPLPEDTAPAQSADSQPAAAQGEMIDPETASREELMQIPGIEQATADALIAGRPYADMLAVDQVLASTLSEEQRSEVYRTLWKPIDLNTASREEILLIPDVDPRMPHEFEEYRPYDDIEKFRREIGKYVEIRGQ